MSYLKDFNKKNKKLSIKGIAKLIERFLKVETKDGEVVRFRLNVIQKAFVGKISRAIESLNGKPLRIIVLKGRQFGFSTFILAWFFIRCLLVPNTRAAVISHESEATKKLFRRVHFFAKMLLLEPTLDTESQREYSFPLTNSYFYIGTAGTKAFGRGDNLTHTHCSEVAFWQNPGIVMNGLTQAVGKTGTIIVETTANGVGNYFYKLWRKSYKNPNSAWLALFFKWTRFDEYELDPGKNFKRTEEERKICLKHPEMTDRKLAWRRWKISETETEPGYTPEMIFKQEYPLCVSGDTKVLTSQGLKKIKDIKIGGEIKAKYNQGKKQCFKLETKMGYQIECTDDHPILTKRGFIKLKDLKLDDKIILGKGGFGNIKSVEYNSFFVNNKINIDNDLALFIGFFMGDGSYYKDCVSIVCDRKEDLVIEKIEELMDKILGGCSSRITGEKKGCVELRKSNKEFLKPFKELELIEKRGSNGQSGWKRKINVPNYILNAPKNIVKSFLIGLFEADGFVDITGNRIILFSKYEEFLRDIQLLLLNFGITSKLNRTIKKTNKYNYIGNELVLRKLEVNQFRKELGFVSEKKKNRVKLANNILKQGIPLSLKFEDEIKEIKKTEEKEVFDITTESKQFIGNGIVVHNCPREAFVASGDTVYDIEALESQEPIEPIRIGDLEEKIWKEPSKYGIMSYMGIDVAEGLENKDRTSIDIYDHHLEQVCHWSGWCDPDEGAKIALILGERYKSYIVPEVNNMGLEVVNILKKKYKKNLLYRREVIDTATKQKIKKYGWRTTGSKISKARLVGDMIPVIRDNEIKFNNFDTVEEFMGYIKDGKGGFNAPEGGNDDRVISSCLALQGFLDRPPSIKYKTKEAEQKANIEAINKKWRADKKKKAKKRARLKKLR